MRALLLLLLLQCTLALAAETGRPTGRNCDLSAPPDAAGEEFDHGITLRIYPRARDIDSRYSGCQIMWAPEHGQRVVLTMTVIESGDPVRIWSPIETDSLFFSCIYREGQVISGDADDCIAAQTLIKGSLAPGCVEKTRQAVAAGGISAPRPPGCEYD